MAQKRMFDKRIVDSDRFIDLPNSTKALYFMAGMSADDRGFFQPKKLQRECGFSDDDYKILLAKGLFMTFESGVMVITDWNKNNWLDTRRITETEYIDELNMLKIINGRYTLEDCFSNAKPPLSQNRIEEYSIEENRIEESSIEENSNNKSKASFDQMQQIYNDTCSNLANCKIKTDARVKAVNTFNKQFTDALDTWKEICVMANNNKFLCGVNNSKEHKNWKATFDWLINVNNATKVLEGKYDENELSNMSRGLQVLSEIESEVE